MRPQVYYFVQTLKLNGLTLEVGSMDINGSVRDLFKEGTYIGLDMRPGKNVDVVAHGDNIPFPDAYFDNVLYLDTMEHDSNFWMTIPEMKRVLRPGGTFVIAVPGFGFPRHDEPCDYWRFTGDAVKVMFSDLNNLMVIEPDPFLIMAVGEKPK